MCKAFVDFSGKFKLILFENRTIHYLYALK